MKSRERSDSGTVKNYFESKGYSKSTVKHYYHQTLDFLSWLDGKGITVDNVTKNDILGYLSYLKQIRKQANFTRSIHLNVIRHFFNYQIMLGERSSNPAEHILIKGTKTKKVYLTFSKVELEQLYNDYELPGENHKDKNKNWFWKYKLGRQRNKVALSLLIHQGLTTAEINHLTPKNLNLREGNIYIEGGRKSKERTLNLKPQQILELMEYQYTTRKELLEKSGSKSEQLIVSIGSHENAKNIWKPLSKELKLKHSKFINLKQVRASVITHWLSQYNLRKVQYMAGHKYVSSTEAYKVNDLEGLKEDIEKYHPLG